jgi:AcrR family transcriptional regulator
MGTTATKEKILTAAMALVAEKGYLGTPTRAIAREAGVTELTLFRHFGSKERLFEALLARSMFLPALRELLPRVESLTYEEALRTIAERFLLSLKEHKPLVKIMHSEINLYPGKVKKIYGQLIDETRETLARYFATHQRTGTLRSFPPDMAARAFLGMLFSYFRAEELMRRNDITRNRKMERDVKCFVDLFVHGTLGTKDGTEKRRQP